MPPSTPWIRSWDHSEERAASPTRPNEEDIERRSPEPLDSTHHHVNFNLNFNSALRNHRQSTSPSPSHQPLQGLGLSSFAPNDPLNLPQDSIPPPTPAARNPTSRKRTAQSKSRHDHEPKYQGPRGRQQSSAIANSSKTPKSRGHTRTGSTLDDLANIAALSSPPFNTFNSTFALNLSPTRPSTSYMNGYAPDFADRPSKRIKSERLYPQEFSQRTDDRPRSSYVHVPQVTQEHAELLLSLFSDRRESAPPPSHNNSIHNDLLDPSVFPNHGNHTGQAHVPQDDNPFGPVVEQQTYASIHPKQEPRSPELHSVPAGWQDPGSYHQDPTQNPPPIQAATGTAEQDAAEEDPAPPPATTKKQRKIKPEVQAEECAGCGNLQYHTIHDDSTMNWVGCEACKKWFHFPCAGLNDPQEAKAIDKFICKSCEPQHGKTTFVRKSSRARTAIDYAGLNEGVVKSSDANTMHHYVPKFKDGSISYLQDDFARVRPELMTEDFWASMSGMKRPFVVPAAWNPRFGHPLSDHDPSDLMHAHHAAADSCPHYTADGQTTPSSTSLSNPIATEEVIDVDQDYLGMIMPRNLTVSKVAELYGPHEPVPVIDVKSQETKGKFTLGQWAAYYNDSREKPIRNVISLEVSHSRLGRLLRRPKVVRDIDLEDQVWDMEARAAINKKSVAYYCLMSVADSYTDFHIDFGGSSVYYHILKGTKTFFFIPPEDKYLKKYEEWCMSDQQNSTWLGDLCNNNVTRVDLHEGDTAFIPAGWIHSVWTPKDSLVVGGNFLTRYDYALQLRVVDIEKNTKVAASFKYPHFQKVMWYTLIKYLDEDPVPESLLREFTNDPDYRFLRANSIWIEHAESSFSTDHGDWGYNARSYSKSELSGLPPLRDYLYRTARIAAGLPVENITKKGIDAVKASVPKGHGDPLVLIKLFAAWCAWKIGNVTVPEWFHTDDIITAEIEAREKEKEREKDKNRPESFKVPPERVSARQLAQMSNTPERVTRGTEDEASTSKKKPRTGSAKPAARKSSACPLCKKGRVKCKHKNEASEIDETVQETLEKPRTYSNVTVDVAKLARASPVTLSNESSSKPAPAPPEPVRRNSSEYTANSDLAEAALARMQSQEPEPISTPINGQTPGSASKKSRSKACEECRKSKRRCVHDEYGRVDPAKAAEPSKQRYSASKHHRASLAESDTVQQFRAEHRDQLLNAMDIDPMIDPALMAPADASAEVGPNGLITDDVALSTPPKRMENPTRDDDGDANMSGMNDMQATPSTIRAVSPRSAAKRAAVLPQLSIVNTISRTPDMDNSYSPITTDSAPTESIEKVDPKNRISPTQHGHARDRAKGAMTHDSTKSDVTSPRLKRESSTAISPNMDLMSSKSRRSSSNTSGTTHRAGARSDNQTVTIENTAGDVNTEGKNRGSRASTVVSEDLDDDEKLARSLQAEEHGLRRRASVRAS